MVHFKYWNHETLNQYSTIRFICNSSTIVIFKETSGLEPVKICIPGRCSIPTATSVAQLDELKLRLICTCMVSWKWYVLIYIFLTIAGYDYKINISTLKFEPSFEIRSQQQCLEIEIIDDSLPEDWEVFTLLLSTNNSEVQLFEQRVDVYIIADNGKHLCWLRYLSDICLYLFAGKNFIVRVITNWAMTLYYSTFYSW